MALPLAIEISNRSNPGDPRVWHRDKPGEYPLFARISLPPMVAAALKPDTVRGAGRGGCGCGGGVRRRVCGCGSTWGGLRALSRRCTSLTTQASPPAAAPPPPSPPRR
jgi:hypothetical protein